ncbi:hypothetical protein F5B22DRAFT_450554 [Xylaria bambusicola]|uniref:uncharacterized protein n=1 Tax=Xylaria bambusicola TaxID=326684 RepID=UPI00200761B2|nr:uncharacterized protein F5B22DRAFT_450554 [Xylaria bambusicola]KAI0506351.1 hypothetical protein F5B22DRAFT_450554 [Xylaria bambusicola]
MASFPNLRRLFIDARSDDEEREVSRRAVSTQFYHRFLTFIKHQRWLLGTDIAQFYNAVLFMGSVAVFSLIAQRMNATK